MALIIEIKINSRLIKRYTAVNVTESFGSGLYGKGQQVYKCQDGSFLAEQFNKKNGAVNLAKKLLNNTKPNE